jgi:hypothetical protein
MVGYNSAASCGASWGVEGSLGLIAPLFMPIYVHLLFHRFDFSALCFSVAINLHYRWTLLGQHFYFE